MRAIMFALVVAAGCGGSDDSDEAPVDAGGGDAGGGADGGAGTPDGAVEEGMPDPVGYWPFDDSAEDASGENIDLTLVGDATYGDSVVAGLGSALAVDGTGDGAIGGEFIKVGGDDLTVVAWARADGVAGDWNSIVKSWGESFPGQFHLGLGSGAEDTLQNTTSAGTATAAEAFPTGEWVHTAFVLDGTRSQHRLYLNGVVVANEDYTGPVPDGTATGLGVGIKPNDNGSAVSADFAGPWQGAIDEVAIFDEALTTEQINQIRDCALDGVPLSDIMTDAN